MARKKGPLAKEGDVFAVPLRSGGYATGVIARTNGRGVCLGYFFGPRRTELAQLDELSDLDSENALYVSIFGDLGIIRGDWQIIGEIDGWNRENWPMPIFQSGNRVLVSYEEGSLEEINRKWAEPEECRNLPEDGLDGSGYVEKQLTRILDK